MKTRSQPTTTTSTTTTSTTTTSSSTPDQPSPIFSLPLFSWSQPLHISLFIWHPTVQASLIFQPSQTLLNHFTPVPFKTSDPTKVFRRKLSFRKTVSRATFCIRSNLRHDVIRWRWQSALRCSRDLLFAVTKSSFFKYLRETSYHYVQGPYMLN